MGNIFPIPYLIMWVVKIFVFVSAVVFWIHLSKSKDK